MNRQVVPNVEAIEPRMLLSTSPNPILAPPLTDSPPVSLTDSPYLSKYAVFPQPVYLLLPTGTSSTNPIHMVGVVLPDHPEGTLVPVLSTQVLPMTYPVSQLS